MSMRMRRAIKRGILSGLLIGLLASCQAVDAPIPTVAIVPSATPPPPASATPLIAANAATSTSTNTPAPTWTPQVIVVTATPEDTATVAPDANPTLPNPTAPSFPTLPPPFTPTLGAAAANPVIAAADEPLQLPAAFRFGASVNGAEMLAYRHGTGAKTIMLVGGIHAGYEANTVELVRELRAFFQDRPQDIVPGITLVFVPTMNPDALTYGRELRGRFNANEVDLNRNWGCGWSPDAVFQEQDVDPGGAPFSEPETRALGSLIQRVQPDAVMFYHAAANGVYSGSCDNSPTISDTLARVYGEAARYPHDGEFDAYAVTGTAPAWVDSIGIPAIDVELATADSTEFQRNLNGLMAVQRWLAPQ